LFNFTEKRFSADTTCDTKTARNEPSNISPSSDCKENRSSESSLSKNSKVGLEKADCKKCSLMPLAMRRTIISFGAAILAAVLGTLADSLAQGYARAWGTEYHQGFGGMRVLLIPTASLPAHIDDVGDLDIWHAEMLEPVLRASVRMIGQGVRQLTLNTLPVGTSKQLLSCDVVPESCLRVGGLPMEPCSQVRVHDPDGALVGLLLPDLASGGYSLQRREAPSVALRGNGLEMNVSVNSERAAMARRSRCGKYVSVAGQGTDLDASLVVLSVLSTLIFDPMAGFLKG